ncbi:MAG: acyltransferase, partial [Flavobacterium sp.]
MVSVNSRLRELDFLRGIAIILVLFRHQNLFDFTKKMGWIGVDLFFVLSGFLVSGLLFKEYKKFGNLQPGLFLIRRGFKIYPLYYLTYFLYLAIKIIKNQFDLTGFLSEIFFIQNYVTGWGYAYVPTWSLAVEEHFYFGLAFLFLAGLKLKLFDFDEKSKSNRISNFELSILFLLIITFIMRIYSNIYIPENEAKNITMTHLRMDSLLAGVLVSYLYYFKNDWLTSNFHKYKKSLLVIALLFLSFAPFVDFEESIYVRIFGFTLLYISFSIILILFLVQKNINEKLDAVFSRKVVDFIGKIGLSSYSIYLTHGLVITCCSVLN